MRFVKKLIAALLCFCLVFAFVACGGNTDNGETGSGNESGSGGNDNINGGNGGTDVTGYKVVFDCDEHVRVRVYPTQDMSSGGVIADEAYSRDGSTGAYLEDSTGQVNFVLVFDSGYGLNSLGATPSEYYNDIKGYADTQTENGYRITKIAGNITVSVVSKLVSGAEDTTGIPRITFDCDEHVKVTVYKTQDLTAGGIANATEAYARGSDTGILSTDGAGQVNFVLVFDSGYELATIEGTPDSNYNNLKGSASTGDANSFRMTKITGDVTITITSKTEGAQEDLDGAFEVNFVCDEHVKIIVYKTQNLTADGEQTTLAYARDSETGLIDKSGDGQVNFVLVFDSGYTLNEIDAVGAYKNLKADVDATVANSYRVTKVEGSVTVTVTSKRA